jgi:hypothetical protein
MDRRGNARSRPSSTAPRAALRALLAAALVVGVGCGYRPPRFADRPPVWTVADDQPIPLPRRTGVTEQLYYSDAYVRRVLVQALDPTRPPEASDVNSLDEVPSSSWTRSLRGSRDPLAGYRRDGPPELPLQLQPAEKATITGARVAVDARGLRYELETDLSGRPEMLTAAAAITSRLLWALGYFTPEVWVVQQADGTRVAATRWPVGVDLGPTPLLRTRSDDANDVVPHLDRRSLRALGMVAAWLGLGRLEPVMLRDQYLGATGQGHVRHELVGWSGALGVAALRSVVAEANDPDRESHNFFFRLGTFGLSPKPPAPEAQIRWPSLGQLGPWVVPDDYTPSPPFEPIDRLTPADAFWLAKRLASLPDATLEAALDSGRLASPRARAALDGWLRARRWQVVHGGFEVATPLDVVGVGAARGGRPTIVLRDEAIAQQLELAAQTTYEVAFVDLEGAEWSPPIVVRPNAATVVVPLPPVPWGEAGALVVRVASRRDGADEPRPVELHLRQTSDLVRLVGVRH